MLQKKYLTGLALAALIGCQFEESSKINDSLTDTGLLEDTSTTETYDTGDSTVDTEDTALDTGNLDTGYSMTHCDDWDCLVEAANDCSEADLYATFETNILGWVQTTSDYLHIQGQEDGGCRLYSRIDDVVGHYDEDTRNTFLQSGLTEEDIDQLESQVNSALDETEGQYKSCVFQTSDLVNMLTNWSNTTLSTSDYDNAWNCSEGYES